MAHNRRESDHPEGRWTWVRGPSWWREMPQVWKALGVIVLAFMAGVTTWAVFATQFGLPAVVAAQGRQLSVLDERVATIESLPARLQEEGMLLRAVANRLDSLCASVSGIDSRMEDIRCVIWAELEGKNPNVACSPLRPGIRRNDQ